MLSGPKRIEYKILSPTSADEHIGSLRHDQSKLPGKCTNFLRSRPFGACSSNCCSYPVDFADDLGSSLWLLNRHNTPKKMMNECGKHHLSRNPGTPNVQRARKEPKADRLQDERYRSNANGRLPAKRHSYEAHRRHHAVVQEMSERSSGQQEAQNTPDCESCHTTGYTVHE